MSYEFYKVMHHVGLFMLFSALGGLFLNGIRGGERSFPGKRLTAIMHGVGLLLIFVAGFGLMAKLGMMGGGWPGWIILKVCIWLFMGAAIALALRLPRFAVPLWILVIALGGFAAYLARVKPF